MGDLTNESFGEKLVDTARQAFGRLDCIAANAGFPVIKSFEEGSAADLDYAFRGNVFSFCSLARAAADLLKESASGRVVAVGSFTSHVFRTDIRQFPLSAASKGALETAVRSLSVHFAKDGVTVNCVVPGYIEKDKGTDDGVPEEELLQVCSRIPLRRVGTPDDVASVIEFMVSSGAGYITGETIRVTGGESAKLRTRGGPNTRPCQHNHGSRLLSETKEDNNRTICVGHRARPPLPLTIASPLTCSRLFL
jgi:3-oxoacyl-[acyl-carrier protein] reductase